jgi:hypothetical protein
VGGTDSAITFLLGPPAGVFCHAFKSTDFSGAETGATAFIVSPNPLWISRLPAEPSAQRMGTNSNAGIGATGSARSNGTNGAAGATGATGTTGATGLSTVSYTSDDSTINLLQVLTTVSRASRAVNAATSNTTGLIGIASSTVVAGSAVLVNVYGTASCLFDGSTAAGDYVEASTGTAGNCHDAGATYPTSNQVLGLVLSSNGSSGTYSVFLFGAETRPETSVATEPTGASIDMGTAGSNGTKGGNGAAGAAGRTGSNQGFGAAFGSVASGSPALVTDTAYVTVPHACTIAAWNITVNAGTATFDIWKGATGTAITSSSNSITGSAQPAISMGTAIHSTTLTGWTTSVSANDIVGINLKTVSTATFASIVVECD